MIDDASKLWAEVLGVIKPKVPEQSFMAFLEPTCGDSISQNTLWVKVPNTFFIQWIEDHYRTQIYEAIRSLHPELAGVKIKYKTIEGVKETGTTQKFYQEDSSHLQSRYLFDNFVIDESNKFAHAASLAVARNPGHQFNPLFIYGGVGLGKTHLLQATGNYIKTYLADLKVYYVTCERLMLDLIDALRENKMPQFKGKYRKKDVLLIDDIEFLEGKESLQEEIFHTFNALYDDGKQVVFSSDRPPSAFTHLEERLASRFKGGLVCDIKPPSFEARVAILKKKTEALKIVVTDEIILFIAKEIKSNIRDLQSALVKLFAFSSFTNGNIDLSKAQELLKDMLPQNNKKITVDTIQKVVSSYYNIPVGAIRGKRRMQAIVLPRDVAIYLSREYIGLPLKEIGKQFGGRDHATVIHSYNKINSLLEKDIKFKDEINNILKLINGE